MRVDAYLPIAPAQSMSHLNMLLFRVAWRLKSWQVHVALEPAAFQGDVKSDFEKRSDLDDKCKLSVLMVIGVHFCYWQICFFKIVAQIQSVALWEVFWKCGKLGFAVFLPYRAVVHVLRFLACHEGLSGAVASALLSLALHRLIILLRVNFFQNLLSFLPVGLKAKLIQN